MTYLSTTAVLDEPQTRSAETAIRAVHRIRQRVYLVRHGESEQTLRRLEPVLLDERFALVLTSPSLRARITCEMTGLGQNAQTDADLLEWNYGDYEGLTPRQIRDRARGWVLFRDGCPGGESAEEVGTRIDRVIARIRIVNGHVALFADGHIFRVLAARWLGLPARDASHFLLDTASVSILTNYHGIPAIKAWNSTSPS